MCGFQELVTKDYQKFLNYINNFLFAYLGLFRKLMVENEIQ